MSAELLPCPFCGATDGRLVQAFTRTTETFAFWSVECLDCGVEVADDESQERADAAWNTRAPADLRSALEAGSFLLDRLADHENCISSEEDAREWHGHVAPAIARFRAALAPTKGDVS
jgi:Lar family restriction alleviation protein